jgi:hypothetical protein
MYLYMLGGPRGSRWDAHLKLAVMWPYGGGPDVSRVVTYADDASLEVSCYSFDDEQRSLGMRLCRIDDGRYRVAFTDAAGQTKWEEERDIRRFDIVDIPLPPRTEGVITVEQLEQHNRAAHIADLAIDPWEAVRDGSTVTATVHNIGDAPARDIVVRLYDGDDVIGEKRVGSLASAADFVAKRTTVSFRNVPDSHNMRVVIDPDESITEILEGNNTAYVE